VLALRTVTYCTENEETPIEEHELRCFEVFRNACKDVEVITFDELLAKLEYLQQHLQPIPDEVPF
jgi:hypothetical protein